ncbi:MAG: cytochrome P450 [Rhodospirillales bacterium]
MPAHLVVDFDVYDPPGGTKDLHGAWRALHDGPDIVWAPYHGGHWIVTRAEDIDYLQRTHDPFSMKDVTMPSGTRPTRLLPLEADPPEHGPFRSIINPWFSPRRIASLENDVQELAGRLIDGFQPRGTCEFMSEFALQLPIAIFMRLTNLPMQDRERLLAYTQMTTRGTAAERGQAHHLMMDYLGPVIKARRADPGEDLLSGIVHAKVGGAPINDTDMMSVLLVILFGGLDTVASTLGFIAHFLAGSPGHRAQLRADPALIRSAVDEFMRRFSPSNTARTLTSDFSYKGVQFKKNEKIYVPPILAGMDERRYTDALAIDFCRADKTHSSFGAGPHRCPGAILAQLEIKLFLQEWLARIPDFHIKPGETPLFGTGQVNCVERLVLAWTV